MRHLLAKYEALSAYERESLKDTLLAAFGGACVIGVLLFTGGAP